MSRKSLYSSRTHPSVFFGLPDQLKVWILDEWLELPNLIREWENRSDLVRAVRTSRLFQADLVRLFSSDCVFRCLVKGRSFAQLQWLITNQIRVSNVEIQRAAIEANVFRTTVLTYLAPTVQRVQLNIVNSFDFAEHEQRNTRSVDSDSEYDSEESGDEENKFERNTFQTNQILSELFASFTNLKHFHLYKQLQRSYVTIVLPDNFGELFTQCVHLESIRLQSCVISALIIEAMCKAPNLTRVSLPGCTMADISVEGANESPVRYVETNSVAFCALFPHLQEVSLTWNTADDVVALAHACTCVRVAAVTMSTRLEATHAHEICKHWCSVSSLTFTSVNVHYAKLPITEDAAVVFIKHCPSLQYFYTGYTFEYGVNLPPCVYPAQYKGSHLRELYVRVDWTSDCVLKAIVAHCPYLHTLHLCNASYSVLSSVHLLNTSSVKHLHLQSCDHLTDYDIASLRTIETLHVGDAFVRSGGMLSCNGIVNMARNCPSLRALYFKNINPDLAMCVLDVVPVCPSLRLFAFNFGTCASDDKSSAVLIKMVERLMRERNPEVKVNFAKKMIEYY